MDNQEPFETQEPFESVEPAFVPHWQMFEMEDRSFWIAFFLGVVVTITVQIFIGLFWFLIWRYKRKIIEKLRGGADQYLIEFDEESQGMLQETGFQPPFVNTQYPERPLSPGGESENEGSELTHEMKWRLDPDANVEGGRFQWGWERYGERGDIEIRELSLNPTPAEVESRFASDFHIRTKVSGYVPDGQQRFYLFAKLQFPPENLYLIELRVFMGEGRVEAKVKSDCSCTRGSQCTYCASFLAYLRVAIRSLFGPAPVVEGDDDTEVQFP
mmetsp:Transcript_5077/g.6454  ORF Transcript_5077/g.6454 Transcript_5077/m.6454 type:complete len:271 (+) Transcript_5077:274-1086(+)|eukprot:CAMPEP_0201491898 /NCGR_PEP_ID=MMETSP0151_2-20130828/31731_1 /ASSEMBLY_ACC=CAM_ASM_000257 /TAXON_ID=200890 /ORGANISM="Paramoeba atlantica, Strain 621/1 / CCAP 1560/9" /LENGTH=270 /DNA_ID=CAMNT_0047878495 /DNA_START=258 /DNA_END=1070 /DNA_ORIENTATION=+